jgi:branched-chain amino acid transport system permease protein
VHGETASASVAEAPGQPALGPAVNLRGRWTRPALLGGALLVAALVPVVTQRADLLNLLFLLALYVTLGQSWNIVGGFAGQTNLGHAAFFGTGALIARSLWTGGAPYPLAFIAGGAAAVAVAVIVGIPTFRLRGAYFAIGTLAVGEALRITISNVFPLITSLPVALIASYDLGARYYLAVGLAAVTTLAAYLLLRSRASLGILAVREDEEAAQATGVDPLRHKLGALILSSFFAGLAGSTFAFHQVGYYPSAPYGPNWTFDAILVTYIGGVGTLVGPVVGAAFYVLVREALAVNLVQLHPVIFGALFIAVVLALPGGLIDGWSRLRTIGRRSSPGRPPPQAG